MIENQESYNNYLNEIFSFFNSLNREFSPSFHLVDTFLDCFSIHSVNQKDVNAKITYYNKLNSIYENSLIDQNTILIISDASVKNNVATLVSHIHRGQDIIAKTIHYVMNVTSTEAELFAIRCSINHTTQIQDIIHIIIVVRVTNIGLYSSFLFFIFFSFYFHFSSI